MSGDAPSRSLRDLFLVIHVRFSQGCHTYDHTVGLELHLPVVSVARSVMDVRAAVCYERTQCHTFSFGCAEVFDPAVVSGGLRRRLF